MKMVGYELKIKKGNTIYAICFFGLLLPIVSIAQDCKILVREFLEKPNIMAEVKLWSIENTLTLTEKERDEILRLLKLNTSPYGQSFYEEKCIEAERAKLHGMSIESILGKERSKQVEVERVLSGASGALLHIEGFVASAAEEMNLSSVQKSDLFNVIQQADNEAPFWTEELEAEYSIEQSDDIHANRNMALIRRKLEAREKRYREERKKWIVKQLERDWRPEQLKQLEPKLMTRVAPDSAREFTAPLNYEQSVTHLRDKLHLSKQEEAALLQVFQTVGQELDKLVYAEIKPKLARGEPGDLSVPFLRSLAEEKKKLVIERSRPVLSEEKYNRFIELWLEGKVSVPHVSGVEEMAADDGFKEEAEDDS